MRAILISEFGGPEVLRLADLPDPVPGPGEVLVRVHATSVNPSDVSARLGQTHARIPDMPMPFTPGWDIAGEIVAGADADRSWSPGERVLGLVPWAPIRARVGTYAGLAAVDSAWLAPMPPELDYPRGATLPLSGLTAKQGLDLVGLQRGGRLLVTGAGGAVGGFATQLAVAAGHEVLAVAGRHDEDWVRSLGPAQVLARDADLSAVAPLDGVFDAVPVGPRSAAGLRPGGRAVFTRPPGEEPPEGVVFDTIFVSPDAEALSEMARRMAAGTLLIRIAGTFPLSDAPRAHARMDAGAVGGKLILTP